MNKNTPITLAFIALLLAGAYAFWPAESVESVAPKPAEEIAQATTDNQTTDGNNLINEAENTTADTAAHEHSLVKMTDDTGNQETGSNVATEADIPVIEISKGQAPAPLPVIFSEDKPVLVDNQCLTIKEHEFCSRVQVYRQHTNIDWLDRLLLNEQGDDAPNNMSTSTQEALLKQHLQKRISSDLDEFKAMAAEQDEENFFMPHGMIYQDSMTYLGQRGNIAMFEQSSYSYSGGAHGIFYTNLINIDLAAKKRLTLDDLLVAGQKEALFKLLLGSYQEEYSDYAEDSFFLPSDTASRQEALLSNNFSFTRNGILFSYPLYLLAPYAAGEPTLELSYNELVGIIKDAYLIRIPRIEE